MLIFAILVLNVPHALATRTGAAAIILYPISEIAPHPYEVPRVTD